MNGNQADEDIPDHLYDRLPEHLMTTDEKGRRVPDYLRMILMCELERAAPRLLSVCAEDRSKSLLEATEPARDTFDVCREPFGKIR